MYQRKNMVDEFERATFKKKVHYGLWLGSSSFKSDFPIYALSILRPIYYA